MQNTELTIRPLAKEYEAYGYLFREVKREGLVAIYEQINQESGKVIAHEIFVIEELPEQWVGPKKYHQPPRENVPGKEQWGRKGWTRWTLEHAMEKFNELCLRQSTKEAA